MMFMIGQGERIQLLGEPEQDECLHCGEAREFQSQLKYSYGQFDALFGFVYNKRYELVCTTCSHGWRLNRRAAEQTYGKPRIPFLVEYGFAVLLGIIASVVVAAYFYRHAA
ncbi:hypothetical protein [Lysobacter humi (ex Lee et al. 2017)]